MVRHVDGRIDTFQDHEVAFDPVAKREVLDVDVASPCRRLLGVAHGGTAVVVFVKEGGGFLWDMKVP